MAPTLSCIGGQVEEQGQLISLVVYLTFCYISWRGRTRIRLWSMRRAKYWVRSRNIISCGNSRPTTMMANRRRASAKSRLLLLLMHAMQCCWLLEPRLTQTILAFYWNIFWPARCASDSTKSLCKFPLPHKDNQTHVGNVMSTNDSLWIGNFSN